MARVQLAESKIRARRRRRRFVLVGIAVVAGILVCSALAWGSQAPFLRISHVTVVGTQTLATSTVADFVKAQMQGDYAYVFPKDNVLIYPKGRIVASLKSSMPVIAAASVRADTFDSITVTIVERQPKALWCGTAPSSATPCFLLDESGVAYGGDLNFEGDAYKQYFGSLSGSTTPKQYLNSLQFRSLSALIDTIAANQTSDKIKSVWVDENSDVRVSFVSGFTLLFQLNSDGGDLYQRFLLAQQSDPFKQHKLSDFEYLDLRFGDKLYYKLR